MIWRWDTYLVALRRKDLVKVCIGERDVPLIHDALLSVREIWLTGRSGLRCLLRVEQDCNLRRLAVAVIETHLALDVAWLLVPPRRP